MSVFIQFQATPPGKQQQSVFARPAAAAVLQQQPATTAVGTAGQQQQPGAARGTEREAAADDAELKREIKGAESLPPCPFPSALWIGFALHLQDLVQRDRDLNLDQIKSWYGWVGPFLIDFVGSTLDPVQDLVQTDLNINLEQKREQILTIVCWISVSDSSWIS